MKKRTAQASDDVFATDVSFFRRDLASFPELVAGHFTVVDKIASGIAGDVIRCRDKSNGTVAVKKVRNTELQRIVGTEVNERSIFFRSSTKRSPCQEDAASEIGILMYLREQLDLPLYLLKLQNVFAEGYAASSFTWVVTEDCEGGELFGLVEKSGPLSAQNSRRYCWQLLQAVAYLHAHGIGHRDISLENVLIKSDTVRLMDFGQAVRSHDSTGLPLRFFRRVGKDFYRAPEVWLPETEQVDVLPPDDAKAEEIVQAVARNAYLPQVRLPSRIVPGRYCRAEVVGYEACPMDVHAVGVSLFIMMMGSPIFSAAHRNDQVFAFVEQNGLPFLIESWGLPAPDSEGMDILSGMLHIDPCQRWTSERALSSRWFDDVRESFVPRHAGAAASDEIGSFALMGA